MRWSDAARPYRPGEVLLLLFPYTGAVGAKKRPALVLADTGDADVVVARVTSEPARDTLDVEIKAWKQAGLKLPSVVRVHKIATLDRALVERTLGRLHSEDWASVRARLRELWEPVIAR